MTAMKPIPSFLSLLALTFLSGGLSAAENLEQAWETALRANHALKATREVTAATASMVGAAKSMRAPNLSLEGGYTRLDGYQAIKADLFGTVAEVPTFQRDSYSYKALITLPLYAGGRIQNGIRASEAMLEAAKQGEATSEQDLRMQVAEAYVLVLRMTRIVALAERHVQSFEGHNKDVENLYAQGFAVLTDRLTVQVALADARHKLIQAKNGLNLALATYNRLLDRPMDQPATLEELRPEIPTMSYAALTEKAVSSRSELIALAKATTGARHQARTIRSERLPQLGIFGGYSYQENKFLLHEDQWIVTVGISWNVFDGGRIRHRARAADQQTAALDEQRRETVSLISLQVRQAWLDWEQSRKQIEVSQVAIAQAEENLTVVRDRYRNGLCVHTEVLDAETLRTLNDTNYANATYDAVLTGLRLKRATGDL